MKKQLSITNLKAILNDYNNPHLLLLDPIIHVAGTNGKGSFVHFFREVLNGFGLTCHSFTSPHITSVCERIVINNRPITTKNLQSLLCSTSHDTRLNFFHRLCIAAFNAFSQERTCCTILETGIGGEADITNVIPNTSIAVITSISNDHQKILGSSIQEIAQNKSGIIKESCKYVLCGTVPIKAYKIIEKKCFEKRTQLISYNKNASLTIKKETLTLSVLHKTINIPFENKLHFVSQELIINLALAFISVYLLLQKIPKNNIKITTPLGRMYKTTYKDRKIILDVAHNEDSFRHLASSFVEGKKKSFFIAIKEDKTIRNCLNHLSVRHLDPIKIYDVQGIFTSQACSEEIKEHCLALNIEKPCVIQKEKIFQEIEKQHQETDIYIIGSFRIVSYFLEQIRTKK